MRECAGLHLKPRKGFSKEMSFEVNPSFIQASLIAQLVKNPPAIRETWVRPLGWEEPLEKGKAAHSRILAWSAESDVAERLSASCLT